MSRVTVGLPVYGGARFLRETLESVRLQTHRDFVVIVSLDGPDPAAEDVCRPFLEDSRFRLAAHPERRGWVENVNSLLSQVETPYWCYQPQDDLLSPRYLEVLLEHLEAAPEAAATHCDISAFGRLERTIAQPSVTGSAVARQLALLQDHHSAVAFRALTRTEPLRRAGGVRHNAVDDFSADTTFMAQVARWGELRRVAATLYRKRYHDANAHAAWSDWPLEKRARGWAVHCADMLEQAMLVDATVQERRLLWLAAVGRLTSPLARHYLPVDELDREARRSLLEDFLWEVRDVRQVDVPGLLEARWRAVRRLTERFVHRSRAS